MLTGKAKTDYQREYMRRRRSNQTEQFVRSNMAARIKTVRPSNGTSQDNIRAATERLTAALGPAIELIDPQSYNPMMVGYVPPKGE